MQGKTKLSLVAIAAVVAAIVSLFAYSGALFPVSASPVYVQNLSPNPLYRQNFASPNTTQPKAFFRTFKEAT